MLTMFLGSLELLSSFVISYLPAFFYPNWLILIYLDSMENQKAMYRKINHIVGIDPRDIGINTDFHERDL